MSNVVYDRAEEPIIISKGLSDKLLKQDNPGELMALYWFYYYTAKWQETNQPKATIKYVAQGLKTGEKKIRENKKKLIDLGLIEEIRKIDPDTKKTKGWYIKVNFIWGKEKTAKETKKTHPCKNPQGGYSHRVENEHPNALNTNNRNALNTNKEMFANQRFAGSDINEIMNLFYEYNPGLNHANKTQRQTVEWFLNKYGKKETKNLVKLSISIQGEQFAPVITTPLELKNKLGKLQSYIKRETGPKKGAIKRI